MRRLGYGDRSQEIYGARLAAYFMMRHIGQLRTVASTMLGLSRSASYNMDKILSDRFLFQSKDIEISFTEMVKEVNLGGSNEREYTYEELQKMLNMRDEYIKVLENIV